MRDIPLFTTELGAASLTLSEIPYTKRAYIRIQSTLEPEAFIKECRDFCRLAGAEGIYITGCDACEKYPVYTAIVKMQAELSAIGQTDAFTFPVTEKTVESFREIYNNKVRSVPGGAWMSIAGGQKLLEAGNGYFIHKAGRLMGTGIASGNEISWVASLVPGGGKTVVQALCHTLSEETVCLQVADTNEKAVRLYRSMGFVAVGVVSKWYVLQENKAVE